MKGISDGDVRSGTTRGDLLVDGCLTVAAAATFLSLSRSKLYELMDDGALPFVKIGRGRRIPRRALIELATAHLQGGWQVDK